MGGDGKVVKVNSKEEWDKLIAGAKNDSKAVLVDFSATWCGPCRAISPYFGELSTLHETILFLSVDVDAVETVAADCNISAMPTFQVWKNGEFVEELVGASKDKLKALADKFK